MISYKLHCIFTFVKLGILKILNAVVDKLK